MSLCCFIQKHSMVFLLNADSEELVSFKTRTQYSTLPKSGVLW